MIKAIFFDVDGTLTVFLKRDEEADFLCRLPEECKFTRWYDNGASDIDEHGIKNAIRFYNILPDLK